MAYVTFTTADACKSYFEKYPNGIDFKHQGKRHTAFVGIGKEVDVVSSMLQAYLECGASRVVRAIGADEDWGMRALYVLAEGKHKNRKVESIVDSYRNQVRLAHTLTYHANLVPGPIHRLPLR